MIQTSAAGQQVQRDIENVISLVLGQVHFEYTGSFVQRFPQIDRLDQLHDCSDPATGDGVSALGKFEFGVRRSDHGRLPLAMLDR